MHFNKIILAVELRINQRGEELKQRVSLESACSHSSKIRQPGRSAHVEGCAEVRLRMNPAGTSDRLRGSVRDKDRTQGWLRD